MNAAKKRIDHMGRIAATTVAVVLGMGMSGCSKYPKDIREFPESWQVMDPGKLIEKLPRIEVSKYGEGDEIAPGDLVEIHVTSQSFTKDVKFDDGDWWVWIGFRTPKETAFFTYEPTLASAFVGLKQGTVLNFRDAKDGIGSGPQYAGKLMINPIGDTSYYSWRKNTRDSVYVYTPTGTAVSFVEIKRVCKGPLQYRTVRLFDDSPVEVCHGLSCYVSNEPRESWFDEAKIEATCNDGRKATFQYGPVTSYNGKGEQTPVQGYFDEWYKKAWQKLSTGVQFEGNRPPVLRSLSELLLLTTTVGNPVRIEILDRAKDPDGDKLGLRVIRQPVNGTLAANKDGSLTYTPKADWIGGEEMSFKVSDGLVEAEGVIRVSILVKKPAP